MTQEEQDGRAGTSGRRHFLPVAGPGGLVAGSDAPSGEPGGFHTRSRVEGGTVNGNLIQAAVVHLHSRPVPEGDVEATGARGRPGKAIGQWDPLDLEVHPAGTGRAGAENGGRAGAAGLCRPRT